MPEVETLTLYCPVPVLVPVLEVSLQSTCYFSFLLYLKSKNRREKWGNASEEYVHVHVFFFLVDSKKKKKYRVSFIKKSVWVTQVIKTKGEMVFHWRLHNSRRFTTSLKWTIVCTFVSVRGSNTFTEQKLNVSSVGGKNPAQTVNTDAASSESSCRWSCLSSAYQETAASETQRYH